MAIGMEQVIERLNDLIKLDVDAIGAYQQAIAACHENVIKQRLTAFQEDHRRHVDDLTRLVRNHGGEPAAARPDVKGFFLAGMTAIRGATGTEGALKAMERNEKLTNKNYDEAARDPDLPGDVRVLIQRNLADERRHLAFIQDALRDRIWESAPANP